MLITFDLDGTLIRGPFIKGVFPVIATLFKDALRQQRGKYVEEEFDVHLHKLLLQEYRKRDVRGKRDTAYDWDDILTAVSQQFGIILSVHIVDIIQKTCGADTCWLKPGAEALLAYLRKQQQPMYVLTNGFKRYQEFIIQYLGINTFFDGIIAPDTTGFAKPDREIFETAKNKDPLRQVCHVGDSLLNDIAGANQANCTTIWVASHLPARVRLHPPSDRASTPECLAYIQKTLADSTRYPQPPIEDCQADYIVTDLLEIIDIYPQLA